MAPPRKLRPSPFPRPLSGRIAEEGQADFYRFQAQPGRELAFEVVEGVQRLWGDLRRAPGFSLELSGSGESWFDGERRGQAGNRQYGRLPQEYLGLPAPADPPLRRRAVGTPLEVKGEPGASYQLQIGAPADFPPLVRSHGLDKLAADRWRGARFRPQHWSRTAWPGSRPDREVRRARLPWP